MNAARELLLARTDEEIDRAAWDVQRASKPRYFRPLLRALYAPQDRKRMHAVYLLRDHCNRRAIPHFVRVLRNRKESSMVRGVAAEALAYSTSRDAIRRLIACSHDVSPDVRFWCVFALGSCRHRRRAVVQALEARLSDGGRPQNGSFWSVGLEALAMLRETHRQQSDEKVREVLGDPLGHPQQWQWASWYGDDSPLYQTAMETLCAAGFDPQQFGRNYAALRTSDGHASLCVAPCSPAAE